MRPPVGQRVGDRGGGNDHDRKAIQDCRRAEPVHLVDRAFDAQRLLPALADGPLQQGSIAEFLPDHLVDMRIARQHRPVGVEHGDGRAASKRDGSEESLVVGRVDPPRHHAEKHPVGAAQPMRHRGGPAAGEDAAYRLRQHGLQLRVGFERLEIGPTCDVDGRQRPGCRRVDQLAVRVEDGDVADIGQHADLGLQHLMRFRRRHLGPEGFGRVDLRDLHLRDQVGRDDLGVLELLVEVAGEQAHGVFQLALAVDDRSLAEFVDHHGGAGKDRRDQKSAAQREPEHGPAPDRLSKSESGRRGRGHPGPDAGNQLAHSPLQEEMHTTQR